jgi:hypothetical protein
MVAVQNSEVNAIPASFSLNQLWVRIGKLTMTLFSMAISPIIFRWCYHGNQGM